jgi:hypothetical protein
LATNGQFRRVKSEFRFWRRILASNLLTFDWRTNEIRLFNSFFGFI